MQLHRGKMKMKHSGSETTAGTKFKPSPPSSFLAGWLWVFLFPFVHLTAVHINNHLVEELSPVIWPSRQKGTGGQEAVADSKNFSTAAATVVNSQCISHAGRKYCTVQRVRRNQTESVSHKQTIWIIYIVRSFSCDTWVGRHYVTPPQHERRSEAHSLSCLRDESDREAFKRPTINSSQISTPQGFPLFTWQHFTDTNDQ